MKCGGDVASARRESLQILVHTMRPPLLLFSLRPFGNINPARTHAHTYQFNFCCEKWGEIAHDVYGFARTRRRNELFNAQINCSPQRANGRTTGRLCSLRVIWWHIKLPNGVAH